MNTKKNRIMILIMLLTGIGLSMFIFFSCEKDIGIETVYSSRDITGVVIDWHNKKSISEAKVTVVPVNTTNFFIGYTDDAGSFILNGVPVLPEPQKYMVRIEKSLYEGQDLLVNCNCDNLVIDTVELKRLDCGLNFASSTFNYGILALGEEKTQSLSIMNPTLLDVIITKVELNINSDVQLDPGLTNTPVIIPTGSQYFNFNITFKPTAEKKYFDTLKIYTQCKPEPYIILILGEGQIRKCSYSPATTVLLTATNKKDSVIIRNLSNSLNLDLKFLHLPSAPFKLDKNVPLNSIITIQPNQSYVFQVLHEINSEINVQDSVVFETNGDCGKQTIPINLKIEKPECSFINYITQFFTFSQDTASVIVQNLSDIPLIVDIKAPDNSFILIPDSLHYAIEPKGYRIITVIFNPLMNGTVTDTLIITTNGLCGGRTFILTGKYEEYGYLYKVLSAWDNNHNAIINPEYRYTGFRFRDDRIIIDSIDICNSMYRFGRDSADFRFEGFSSLYYFRKIIVTAYGGLKKLGNYLTDNKPFTLKDWKELIDDNKGLVGSDRGCGNSFSKGDVLLLRTRENKFVLVMIDTWYQDIHDFDNLQIDYWKID